MEILIKENIEITAPKFHGSRKIPLLSGQPGRYDAQVAGLDLKDPAPVKIQSGDYS
jgi:hypothetical protein